MITKFMGKALVPAGIAYSALMHLAILKGVTDRSHLLLLSLPLLGGASWLVIRSVRAPWRPLVAVVLVLGVLAYVLTQGQHLRSGMIAADGMTHASMNFFMMWFFANTLRRGSEPLISRIARHLEGGVLSPALVAYTRNVTIAWSVFFAAQLIISAILYLFAPLPVWSLFINVLNAPLIALMFAAEYLVRMWRHPTHARKPVAKVMEAFSRNVAEARSKGQ
jgi:uncharacterized membrane protein